MGKIIGLIVGLVFAKSLIAGVLFAIIGHFLVDKKNSRNSAEQQQKLARVQRTFFVTVFKLLGHLAKSDGRVNEHEIALTQILMARMGLSADHKREAINFFKEGAAADFDLAAALEAFRTDCGRRINLCNMVLVYLVELAQADGAMGNIERDILLKIATGLGYSPQVAQHILSMLIAQARFQEGQSQRAQNAGETHAQQLQSAYQALGVEARASDSEIKRAYRKLMSQYHPDKLMGQGLPDDMVKSATERAQEVQSAYDLIKKHRGVV